MAKNTSTIKRDSVKYIRDRSKSAYEKKHFCYICGTTEDLELHHYHSMTTLWENWCTARGYDTQNEEVVLAVRDDFISEHHTEIYEMVVTLCNKHHVKLHSIYGAKPLKGTEPKQAAWVEKQRIKFLEKS